MTNDPRHPVRRLLARPKRVAAIAVLTVLAVCAGSLAGLMLVCSVDLPQVSDLERPPSNTTAELYDRHGRLFASFPLERRVDMEYSGFPDVLRRAVIATDDRDFERRGAIFGVLSTLLRGMAAGRGVGPSTLTMQLARSLFPASEHTMVEHTIERKLQESFLAIQIERRFTKPQIFTLYGNQVYLGEGVYGFEAGSQYYFGKHARDLTTPEAALLAALTTSAFTDSPEDNPGEAFRGRNAVVNTLLEDGWVTAQEAAEARATPLGLHIQPSAGGVADWFVEAVRAELESRFGPQQAHEAGFRVYTTLDLDLQQAADRAVLDGLAAYERRRRWRAQLLNVRAAGVAIDDFQHPDWAANPAPGSYVHAVVVGVLPYQVTARVGRDDVLLTPEDWAWTGFQTADKLVRPGDIIYVHLASLNGTAGNGTAGNGAGSAGPGGAGAGPPALNRTPLLYGTLEQDSGAQGSLLALDNASGDVLAMVGGRDFNISHYNRATRAERQAGSAFLPYVYTAAVEAGARPDQSIDDARVSVGGYPAHDADGRYLGQISLLRAFADSRNVPAIKLAEKAGMPRLAAVVRRFGIAENVPAPLPAALGAVELTLQEQVAAYASFPNDGVRNSPRLVDRVDNADGETLWQGLPEASQVMSAKTARTMMLFLREVTRSGTGAAAAALKRPVAGKTGTTVDFTNAWFIGSSPAITCGVWAGFDDRQPLGEGETGAKVALPVWMDFMQAALAGDRVEAFPGNAK